MSEERRKVAWSLDLDNMRVRAGQFATEMMSEPPAAKEALLQAPLAGALSGRVKLNFAVGRARLNALGADSPNLFEARLRYIGELDYEVSGDAQRQIRLRSKVDLTGKAAPGKALDLHWDIWLARHVPLQLDLRGGLGQAELDMSQLTIETMRLDAGLGKLALKLPARQRIAAEIRGGVGAASLIIPPGAFGRLKIKGGVGQMRVQAAPGSAIRLQGKAGLAAMNLPQSLALAGGSRMKGTWQTAECAAAVKPLLIDYAGGVGGLDLEFADSK